MALTPRTDEAFLREVDDNLRRDRMITAARRWGPIAAVVLVLFLAALAVFLYLRDAHAKAAAREGEQLSAALANLEEGKVAGVDKTLEGLTRSSRDGYRGAAALTLASEAAGRNPAGAGARYKAVAADTQLPQAYRDYALLRSALIDFDQASPAEIVARLRPLAVVGNPYFASAAEMTAIAQLKLGHRADAASLFAAIARSKDAPQSLRGRAERMAGSLAATAGAKG